MTISSKRRLVQVYKDQGYRIIHVIRLYRAYGSNVDICCRRDIEDGKQVVIPGSDGAEIMDELKPSHRKSASIRSIDLVRSPSPSPSGYSPYIRSGRFILQCQKMLVTQLEEDARQVIEEDTSVEQEIECPRCHDIMTLHSEFDRLGYFCECNFSLHLSHC